MLIIMVLKCFINHYMKQHDVAPGIHAYHPYGGVCGIVLLLLGVLSYTYTCETAAQCILPSFESTGLESKIGWFLISVNIHFIILHQSLEGSIHPVICINEAGFFFLGELTMVPMKCSFLRGIMGPALHFCKD